MIKPSINFLILFACILSSCSCSSSRNIVSAGATPAKDLPVRVAILPFQNKTGHEVASVKIREIFYQHFSGKNFIDLELPVVDEALRRNGIATADDGAKALPQRLGEILHVDGLVFGTVTHYASYMKGAMTKVGAEVRLVDAKSGKTIATAGPLTKSLYDVDVPASPYGTAWALVKGLVRDAEGKKFSAIHILCEELSSALPEPPASSISSPPVLYALVHDFSESSGNSPRYKKLNDIFRVAAVADKYCTASFAIEGVTPAIPMKEEPAQGKVSNYRGEYRIKGGDDISNGHLVLTLIDERGNKVEFRDPAGTVNIDTVSPPAPGGLKGIGRDSLALVSWHSPEEKDIAKYGIYRKSMQEDKFTLVSQTSEISFEDHKVENYQRYVYRVTAFDRAGNESTPSGSIQVIPRTPPPTNITEDIIKNSVWYKEASPYHIRNRKLRILPGAELVIQPGAVVQFSKGCIIVSGRLMAKGDEMNPIVFTSLNNESSTS